LFVEVTGRFLQSFLVKLVLTYEREFVSTAVIQGLAVKKELQHSDIGTKLLKQTRNYAKKWGYQVLFCVAE
jgi:N-acetylglutamate synthase-like GNAT family acetyltransferase